MVPFPGTHPEPCLSRNILLHLKCRSPEIPGLAWLPGSLGDCCSLCQSPDSGRPRVETGILLEGVRRANRGFSWAEQTFTVTQLWDPPKPASSRSGTCLPEGESVSSSPFSLLPAPKCRASWPVDSSDRRNVPRPKLLHICAQTKPLILAFV